VLQHLIGESKQCTNF